MKELTDEQYYQIGVGIHENGETLTQNASDLRARAWLTALGRAAYAASFPHAVAEALEEFTDAEWSYISSVAKPLKPRDKDYPRNRADVALSRRVTALTAKPDAAVEAVKVELKRIVFGSNPPPQADEYAAQIVAAVDAARAKEAK